MELSRRYKTLLIAVVLAVLAGVSLWLIHVIERSESHQVQVEEKLSGSEQKPIFEPVLPGRTVKFPDDFAFHPEYRHESWRYFANVTDKENRHYWVQWSMSRLATDDRKSTGWNTPQLYLSNIVVISEGKVWREQRIARGGIGQAGLRARPFRLWLDNWVWRSISSMPLPGLLSVETDSFALSFSSTVMGPYVLEGDQGYVRKHDLLPIASYGVKAPFLSVAGQLKLDGKSISVSGKGWLEKEWGSDPKNLQLLSSVKFSLRTGSGQVLSINRLEFKDQTAYTYGTLAGVGGKVLNLKASDIQITPKEYFSLPNGKLFPLKWSLSVPAHNIDLTVKPLRTDLWHPFFVPLWEGPVYNESTGEAIGALQITVD